jgi:hypothetical protein
MYEIPAPSIPPAEGAVIELSRAVDHVCALSATLGAEDVETIKRDVNRLLDAIFDRESAIAKARLL